jgi:hypothetical protein
MLVATAVLLLQRSLRHQVIHSIEPELAVSAGSVGVCLVLIPSVPSVRPSVPSRLVFSSKRYLVDNYCVYLLVPPALTTVTLSQNLGGYLYPSAAASTVLSLLMPLVMLAVGASGYGSSSVIPGAAAVSSTAAVETNSTVVELFSVGDMQFFFVTLAFAYVLPISMAQLWCHLQPIQSKKHVQHWGVVGAASYVVMAFLVGLAFTPTTFLLDGCTLSLMDIVNLTRLASYEGIVAAQNVSNDFVSAAFVMPLVMSVAAHCVVHLLATGAYYVASLWNRRTTNAMELLDVYVRPFPAPRCCSL